MKPGIVSIRDNNLVIEAPPHVSIRLRRLFGGAQRYKAGVFVLASTPEHAYDLDCSASGIRSKLAEDVLRRHGESVRRAGTTTLRPTRSSGR